MVKEYNPREEIIVIITRAEYWDVNPYRLRPSVSPPAAWDVFQANNKDTVADLKAGSWFTSGGGELGKDGCDGSQVSLTYIRGPVGGGKKRRARSILPRRTNPRASVRRSNAGRGGRSIYGKRSVSE
jgi:hypothetical protein